MKTHNRAAAGASLALLLALTACNTSEQDGGNEGAPSSDASTSASASGSAAEPSPEETDGESSPASASESSPTDADETYVPDFEAVTGEKPASDKEGEEKATEAVKRYYEVTSGLLAHRGQGAGDVLPIVARNPQLERDDERFQRIAQEMTDTYKGESKGEVLSADPGAIYTEDGERVMFGSYRMQVCEDNTAVSVTDEEGKKVSTGTPRYQLEYVVQWNEDKTWKVAGKQVLKDDSGKTKTC